MDFSEALRLIKNGGTVARSGWNGKGMWLKIIGEGWAPRGTIDVPNVPSWGAHNEGMSTAPFIAIKNADDDLVPWLASQGDLLADDWVNVYP